MVETKPSLSKFLPSEDELIEDGMDYRELSNIITKEFPWPIGIELRRMLSGSMADLNRGRLDQILKTVERSVQFVAFILVINLYEELKKSTFELSAGFKSEFNKRFNLLTFGNYLWLISSIGNIFKREGLDFFLPELAVFDNRSSLKKVNLLLQDRNELSHHLVNPSLDDIDVKCVESLEILGELLSDLAFIINYPLVTIPQITVKKNRNSQGVFAHHMLMLNSTSSSFFGTTKLFNQFTDSPSVLLIKNTKEVPTQSLNLSPLIVDTHFEPIDSPEKKRKLRKDVLLYSKYDTSDGIIHYAGTESFEKPDATLLSFYINLKTELDDIINTFSA